MKRRKRWLLVIGGLCAIALAAATVWWRWRFSPDEIEQLPGMRGAKLTGSDVHPRGGVRRYVIAKDPAVVSEELSAQLGQRYRDVTTFYTPYGSRIVAYPRDHIQLSIAISSDKKGGASVNMRWKEAEILVGCLSIGYKF